MSRGAPPKPDVASPAGRSRDATMLTILTLVVATLAIRVATLAAYPLMDNTEARYAEVARRMAETGDWVTPWFHEGIAFWSKPPLSTWLSALSYRALGVSEFSARLPSLLASVAVAWLAWHLAHATLGRRVAAKSVLVLATTPLFFVAAGAVMTDAALAVGTTLSMVGFWRAVSPGEPASRAWGWLFFVGLAIGLLAKGPVGVVLTFLPVGAWTLWKGGVAHVWRRLPWIGGLALTVALAAPWYLLAEARTPGFLDYFFVGEHWKRYTVPGWTGDRFGTAHRTPRGTIWLYAIASTLPWCAVWAALAFVRRKDQRSGAAAPLPERSLRAYLVLWMLAPAVFFTFAGNILFTYVLPGLPAFALLVAQAWESVGERTRWRRAVAWHGLAVPIAVVAVIALVVPGLAHVRSHRDLVREVEALRGGAGGKLVYLREATHSAEFYSRGATVTSPDLADLERRLGDASRDFYALKEADLAKLPAELRERLEPVDRFGAYRLLREKPAGTAAR